MSAPTDQTSLKLLKEAGVEWVAGDEAIDYTKFSQAKAAPRQTKFVEQQKQAVGAVLEKIQPKKAVVIHDSTLNEAVAEATKLADAAQTLDELRAAVEGFAGCALKKLANKTVFADGNPSTRVMLIGEAPGADEDLQGIPFCGMSGQLLDKVLASIGRDRNTGFYITNTVFWRPPGNRKPTDEELAICAPFLEKHVALVAPKMLVLVGATAVQAILQDNSPMTKMRGQFYEYKNRYMTSPTKVMVTYHPSYLMRAGLNKRLAWEDMLVLEDFLRSA